MKIGRLQGYDDITSTYIDGLLPKAPYQFKITLDSDYDDISSIANWDKLGTQEFQYLQVRNYITPLIIGVTGLNYAGWGNLSDGDKILAAKWGLAPYVLRLNVITEDEDITYFKRLLEETAGDKKDRLIGRRRIVEEMRQWVGLNYFRKEIITKAHIDDFYLQAGNILDSYIASNSPYFKQWLINQPGTIYETNGFGERPYYTMDLMLELLNIYNGNF